MSGGITLREARAHGKTADEVSGMMEEPGAGAGTMSDDD